MNILVFQQAAWDDTNSVGNTLTNWFTGWNEDKFANFYTRKQIPHNSIVNEYYLISAVDLLEGLLRKGHNIRRFTSKQLIQVVNGLEKQHVSEQKSIDYLHRTNNEFIYWGMEQVWRSKIWIDKYFKQFVTEFNPDILFAFCTSVYILDPLIRHLRKNYEVKIVLFIADDVYGDYLKKCWPRRGYLTKSFKYCISNADLLYGVSEELCEAYGEKFDRKIIPLYKGCELKNSVNKQFNRPLRIVYAGNLLYGRDDTLSRIADCLETINSNGVLAVLEIYTGTTITKKLGKKLNRNISCSIMGKRTFNEIKIILTEADIVLHVESFEKKQIDQVRYSFSTKIIDCLESGSLVLGVGPSNIASISYLRKIPGVQCITDLVHLPQALEEIIEMKDSAKLSNVIKTHNYAVKHHEINGVRKKLRQDFQSLF